MLETRIITTADIFDALTAERPYRAAMPITRALVIMTEMVGTQIDATCFDALKRALNRDFDLEVPIQIGSGKPHTFDGSAMLSPVQSARV